MSYASNAHFGKPWWYMNFMYLRNFAVVLHDCFLWDDIHQKGMPGLACQKLFYNDMFGLSSSGEPFTSLSSKWLYIFSDELVMVCAPDI